MKRKLQIAAIVFTFTTAIIIGVFNPDTITFADDYAEQSAYQIELENGNKIFVMYPYTADGNDDYLKSGLYYNTVPLENIYLINTSDKPYPQYFYQNELIFTDDGVSFARLPWTVSEYGSLEGIAIEFYANGSLVKRYKVGEVAFNKDKLLYSASHVNWENHSLRNFDAQYNALFLTALDGTITAFDLTTGEMTSRDPGIGFSCSFCGGGKNNGPFLRCVCDDGGLRPWVWITMCVVSVSIVGGIILYHMKKKIKKQA